MMCLPRASSGSLSTVLTTIRRLPATRCRSWRKKRIAGKRRSSVSARKSEELTEETQEHLKSENDSFVTQIYQNLRTSIEYTIQNLDLEQIDEIAQLMNKADIIFCAGVGNSGIPAEACAMRLVRNGKNGIYFKDNHFQSIYLNELKRSDIAILFSASGESNDTIHCAEILKQRKVETVCVTSSVVFSLAVLCDYCILLMYIADLLSTRTGMIDQKTTLKAKETTFDYIIDKMRKERI